MLREGLSVLFVLMGGVVGVILGAWLVCGLVGVLRRRR